uniref:polysaccharide deacetylase family protein n=1 Tax=Ndongobacter massiliensis TaxID=1871025 RepID=UPI0009317936|nr:polysaccharide deacetylase family protein [Ndongobacter massiliensis]
MSIDEQIARRRTHRLRRKRRRRLISIGSVAGVALLVAALVFLHKPPADPAKSAGSATSETSTERPPQETQDAVAENSSPETVVSDNTESTVSESVPTGESSAQEEVSAASEAESSAENTAPEWQTIKKNHLPQADAYTYSAEAVREAMFGGTPLTDGKVAFLTYDDGPSTESTAALLDALKEAGVPATFFMLGQSINEETRPLLERTLAEGHGLALHSYDHQYHALYPDRIADPAEVGRQAAAARDALRALFPAMEPRLWRYPGGHMSWNNIEAADAALAELGIRWIDWNSTNGDAEAPAQQPTDSAGQLSFIHSGWEAYGSPSTMVILMHDRPEKEVTRASVQAIVQALRDEGFTFGIIE